MWDGGESRDSAEGIGTAAFILSSLFSPFMAAGGTIAGAEAGSEVGDSVG